LGSPLDSRGKKPSPALSPGAVTLVATALARMNPPKRGMSFVSLFFGESGALASVVFRNQKFNVSKVCLLAWMDTVYSGMACHGRLISNVLSGSEDSRLARLDSFFQTWYKHQVFCSGDARKPM
jgi:hypothetical protein